MKPIINTVCKWAFTFSMAAATLWVATRQGYTLSNDPLWFCMGVFTLIAFIVAVND